MTRYRVLAAVPVLVLLVGCDPRSQERNAPPADGGSTSYEADGTVLEDPGHGAELCLGGVADSYPPQCGGLPLEGWDWAEVEGEESASGTTWGDYHVVGTFDGTTFTVSAAGPIDERPSEGGVDPVETPCRAPDGGWVARDPRLATDDDLIAVAQAVRREPDFSGVWVDYVGDPAEGAAAPGEVILNVAFTGDLERHEAELNELWGGPLCVVQFDHTLAELRQIQAELSGQVGEDLGLDVVASGISEHEHLVHAWVVVADEDDLFEIEERYGAGVVRLEPALTPVA